ncbi:hypothetical protein [Sphingomonas sp. SRS2]|uniref:hypothetical protein n=1 Tax=Sphingomonas sp. SRS2 TaxID=133190 RepID=UPI000AF9AD2F|nr:hypothetical protein [Sphingomonas sp. SRS2]
MSERPFIAWYGQGPLPATGSTVVEVQLRIGTVHAERADFIMWYWCRRSKTSFDVVAYRLPAAD